MVVGAIVRPFIRQLGKYLYQGLRQQDRLIDYTYRKSGLYNRGVVRGIKHGLAGGQIVGGIAQLGLNSGTDIGNDAVPTKIQKQRAQTRKSYQTRGRYSRRPYCRNTDRYKSNQYNRYSSTNR